MGRSLPIGANCHFTAIIQNGFNRIYEKLPELRTSCTVHENGSSMILPATCSSDSSETECSCHCAEGFKTDNTVNQLLTCSSKIILVTNCCKMAKNNINLLQM